jgi:rRNA maturation protein Nop10
MTAGMTQRYYRVQSPEQDPQELLHPGNQVTEPWGEDHHGPCDKCQGTGRTDHECESCKAGVDASCPSCAGSVFYERECPACGGSGRIDEPARRGISVFPDEDGLYRYMLKREGRLEGRALVVLAGELSEDEDVDADEGALLVRPTEVVEVRDVDRDCVERLRRELRQERSSAAGS